MNASKIFSSGVLFAVVGIILFSAKAVLVKIAYRYDISAEHLLLFRMGFALPFYVVIAIVNTTKVKSKAKQLDYLWIVFFGFIGYYLASYFDFLGLQYITAGLERIILFVYPTLVLILSRIFLKKTITKPQVIAIVLTYVGVIITFWGAVQFTSSDIIIGTVLIFLSALTYASYLVGSGWLIPKFGVVTFTSYAMIVSSLGIIIQYLITDRGTLTSYPVIIYVLGLAMAIFATIVPSYLVSAAIARLGASNFAIIASLGPISTIVLAYFFLDEHLSVLQLLGTFIVIIGVFQIAKTKK